MDADICTDLLHEQQTQLSAGSTDAFHSLISK